VAALATAGGASAHKGMGGGGNGFTVTNLVSDQAGMAAHTDANLTNAWGLVAMGNSPWWVSNNHSSTSTVYDASGNPFPPSPAMPLVVPVQSDPTGMVASSDSAFPVGTGTQAGPSRFLWGTEDGTILGWHNGLPAAMVVVDKSGDRAVFKGLATMNDRLYATDFRNGEVDIFDASYTELAIPNHFEDPTMPPNYSPFGIQAINGHIFVTFAIPDDQRMDDVHCHGCGIVDEFDANGAFITRVADHGQLNAPWGLAMAPPGFGRFGGDLLVGNFGNGKIHAFKPNASDPTMWTPAGHLQSDDGGQIQIGGLWALEFGLGGTNSGSTSTLFFTAGPNDEADGLFGTITNS
jgi:uncharacterized protein (TIGR03118 family)